jgi:hypothetical protein
MRNFSSGALETKDNNVKNYIHHSIILECIEPGALKVGMTTSFKDTSKEFPEKVRK